MISRRTILKMLGLAPVVAPVAAVAAHYDSAAVEAKPDPRVVFKWDPVPGATGYRVILGKNGSENPDDLIYLTTERPVITSDMVALEIGALYQIKIEVIMNTPWS